MCITFVGISLSNSIEAERDHCVEKIREGTQTEEVVISQVSLNDRRYSQTNICLGEFPCMQAIA